MAQNFKTMSYHTCFSPSSPDANLMDYYVCGVVPRTLLLQLGQPFDMQWRAFPTFILLLPWKFLTAVIVIDAGFKDWCHTLCMWILVQNVQMKRKSIISSVCSISLQAWFFLIYFLHYICKTSLVLCVMEHSIMGLSFY